MAELYAQLEYTLASLQLAFAMLGMGALLSLADFAAVFRRPRELVIGLGLQLVVVPALAVAWVALLELPAGLAAGVALLAAVPGGTLSNVVTWLARGNIALSISLTAVTTALSLLSTPVLLRLLSGTHLPRDFEMPVARIAFEIAAVLLAPLATGMAAGALAPARRAGISRASLRLSLFFLACMVVGAAASGRLDARAYGVQGLLAIVALCAVFQLASFAVARLARLAAPEAVAIAIEVTIRNANLALLVKASLFPASEAGRDPVGDGMFFAALLYGGAALPLSLIPVGVGRRAERRRAAAAAARD